MAATGMAMRATVAPRVVIRRRIFVVRKAFLFVSGPASCGAFTGKDRSVREVLHEAEGFLFGTTAAHRPTDDPLV